VGCITVAPETSFKLQKNVDLPILQSSKSSSKSIPTRQKLWLKRKKEEAEEEEEEEEDDDDEYLVLVSSSPRLQSQLPRAATKRGQKRIATNVCS
jgi:hypothetical protein